MGHSLFSPQRFHRKLITARSPARQVVDVRVCAFEIVLDGLHLGPLFGLERLERCVVLWTKRLDVAIRQFGLQFHRPSTSHIVITDAQVREFLQINQVHKPFVGNVCATKAEHFEIRQILKIRNAVIGNRIVIKEKACQLGKTG